MTGKVGVIGLGNMGFHMACNLLKKGSGGVVGFDVAQQALERLRAEGGTTASSPAELAEQCDTVLTMLPNNDHVRTAYLGDEGVLKTLAKGSLCIDSSTIDPIVARALADEVVSKGSTFMDAPVSGGVGGAELGTLTFMVGAKPEEFSRCEPILSLMGKSTVHCGDIGTGQVAKLCNNLVLGISMLGVSEAMNLGSRLGIDRKVLAGIMNTSTARCWSSDTYNPAPGVMEGVPSARDYENGFGSALMLKDLGLVADAAKKIGAPIPMGENAHALYQIMVAQGYGSKDFGIAFKFLGGTDSDEETRGPL
ncbi:3-hydroxyisobutyrate dehydrogenase, mitochondrial [Hondaea fermentalgiana]|uniref:3-hydroxyisobutyrate dehydrogenase n=1 Tax=Hondaea fermentalgiana TaxID=2315210 RepID=A0A2R5GQF4_9STRA|nr:3-hydroxyisobutyrate dehydrogenase, mitochondrial [Hondaea fermentalgiana]|eukprot:GBG32845.1 3-hydroxyisobutyrate dehydrogenase, mitochondrial [Hondaea fermentalgiana]